MLLLLLGCTEPAPPPPSALLSAQQVTVRSDGVTAHAQQAVIDSSGNVTAEVVHATAPPLRIEAENAEWLFAEQMTRFAGQVVATRADVTLRCDVLTVRFSSPERVERARAEGGVVVEQGSRRAEAAVAELIAQTGELVLTGSPSVTEGGHRLAGERITFWLDQERVECQSCQLVVDGAGIVPQP